jgi:hypothetical protein
MAEWSPPFCCRTLKQPITLGRQQITLVLNLLDLFGNQRADLTVRPLHVRALADAVPREKVWALAPVMLLCCRAFPFLPEKIAKSLRNNLPTMTALLYEDSEQP